MIVALALLLLQDLEDFEPLFNGKDFAGWHGMGHCDPRSPKKEDLGGHWRVENGEIVNDGAGPFLTTDRAYGDIEMMLEYRTVAKADSGVYLRGTPQVQIWDYTKEGGKWDLGADKGSGGLWNNSPGAPGKDPLVRADKPFGEWNKLRILQIGARTSVWLNEKLVVDRAILENFWDRKQPLFPKGPIQLQTHGGEIRWKNLRIREIEPAEANRRLGDGEGFATVFNGRDFEGWSGPTDEYEVRQGAIVCRPDHGGTIYTKEEYSDFVVRFEFKLPKGGNNGLAIRYPGRGDTAYVGMCELQVLDNDSYPKLDPRQYHGSAYGMAAAHRGYLRPVGEWNFQEVTVKGSAIRVELNGTAILDADLSKVKEFMGGAHPGKDRKSGHFGFAGHGDAVAFRNIRIRRIE